MIHSMTGFAVQNRELGAVTLHLELRSVNSRYLDLAFRIADDLRQAEPMLRERLAARLNRGKVECRLNLQTNEAAPRSLALNGALVARLLDAQDAVQAQFADAKPLSVADILRWPGMLADDSVTFEQMQPAILELTDAALAELVASRPGAC